VTNSESLAKEVSERTEKLISDLPEPRKGYLTENMMSIGGIILCKDFDSAIDFVNAYAPEHLQIFSKEPFAHLNKIKNAGEILLGDYIPSSLANFSIGVNAVLPTGGFAKTFSAVSVRDFLKYISLAYVTEEGFPDIAKAAIEIAEYENFPAHKQALELRMKK
jgi:histidinol dehydrogenase